MTHLTAVMPSSADSGNLTLLILAATITLVFAAIRWTARRTHVFLVISGTGVLLVILTVLVMAYLAALRMF
ncbi:hypothetical protein AB0G15_39030 [Streptosporangium sp. NPDC023825]|uniref:hypothetical protein n=1 Tax=Streptosporangium sp. NPDC023825 TaxID=3154909 RepID=UPI003425D16B